MEFLNQVKKLKNITKSSEVKALCENFINGGSVSKDLLIESLENHNISDDTENKIQTHFDAIRNEEMEASRKVADSIMESWGGINNNKTLGNSGSYGTINEALTDPAAIDKAFKPLKKGDKGQKVKELQIYLGVKPIDGIFGESLVSTVKAFQKKNKLTPDGIVGIDTLKKIIEIFHALVPDKSLADQASLFYGMIRDKFCNEDESFVNEALTDKAAIEKAYKPLKKGDKGERVKELQKYLGVKPIDGIFGDSLLYAVKAFQKKYKLTPDGIVGINTLKKIMEIFFLAVPKKSLLDQAKLFYQEISNKFFNEEASFLSELDSISSIDGAAQEFIKSNEVNNLGILESIDMIKTTSIYTYPKARIICEQYRNLIINNKIPEFALIHNFLNDIQPLNWDDTVKSVSHGLTEKLEVLSREIEVSKVIETIKNSGSSAFYSDLSDTLNEWLILESKSNALLVKNISRWSFNPVVRNLINFINLNENNDNRKLQIPSIAQGESSVYKVFSPVMLGSDKSIFYLGGNVFESNSAAIKKLTKKEVTGLSSDYIQLIESFNKPYVRINEEGIFIQIGKSTVRIIEEGEEVSVYLGKRKLRFSHPSGLAKILGLESATYFAVNETQVVSDIMRLYTNYRNIVELDFAKSISSNVFEGLAINLIKWNKQIYLQKINQGMNENSIYKVTGNQAVSMVKEFMRYDISEGLTEFLVGENKIKSIMVNDRDKVIGNISKVEEQINKLESLMSNNPLYSASPEIMKAKKLLEGELIFLREKWNQINLEISSSESTIELENSLEIFEDEKFNIGDFIKVKESGDTGKIISIDATSGRYTVLLDTGKTSDFLISEITDLEEALSQAAEDNSDSSEDDDSEEEVKENFGILSGNGNRLNKSEMSLSDQKKLLTNFSKGHGFSKAPGDHRGTIDIKMDSLHGYNSTMNNEE